MLGQGLINSFTNFLKDLIEGEKRIFEYNFFYSMISDEKTNAFKEVVICFIMIQIFRVTTRI